ncbi:orotate phosphoribosyltransferase [Roseivirga echinicomitans]|uniref:Orotate phosphoribosyltransferase n=1 Tax=Roseivirga echinicomitans TaxID=296218 RepID=A0A150XJM8_9BACT|nr:orotate phosphoribosyltransferase [Roseivirga echinicomitans]KYG78929.1 orotate phosphoribosyltransferase [Roseivirga echinicomitans]
MEKIGTPKDTALRVASDLLEIKAIQLNKSQPFTWSSGWKSPIYCDNRLSLSFPATRTYIKKALAEACKLLYPEAQSIAGVATAGIPQGALLADEVELPFIYVRSSPKGHGMENLIEGKVAPGQKVVIVEDLVSTGGSSLKAAEALKAAGYEVLGMLAIFTYGFPLADDNFEKAGIKLHCLSNYSVMLEKAKELGYVNQDDLASLEKWRQDPSNWKG